MEYDIESGRHALTASLCKSDFKKFVKEFWSEIPGAGTLIWGWHMGVLCDELQTVAERVFANQAKEYDLVINISPGTSKSSIGSILFQPWTWTRMPNARHITASHTDSLVLDLATKSRFVLESDKFREFFPLIELRKDQKAKGDFANTLGGERKSCTVAGKTPTGRHAHFLCFPYETLIQSNEGEVQLGDIVENRLPVQVLAMDLQGKLHWRDISKYEKNPGSPLCRINFSDGSKIEATEEHPFFVQDVGYVFASDLRPNDKVIDCVHKHSSTGKMRLLSKDLSVQSQETSLFSFWSSFLQAGMCRSEETQTFGQNLRNLWEKVCCLFESKENREFLFCEMSRTGNQRREKPFVGRESENQLSSLWENLSNSPSQFRKNSKSMLFQSVCGQTPFRQNDWIRELQLHSRQSRQGLFREVPANSEMDSASRQTLLFVMQQNRKGIEQETRCSPCRLRQVERLQAESSKLVSILSRTNAWKSQKSFSLDTKVVSSIEQSVRIPSSVYNLEIASDHTYFAEGILVHNCTDDPIDPKKAISEAEQKIASDFMTQVLPSRKVRTTVDLAVTITIMQRMGLNDPTDVLLKTAKREGASKIRHVCLPAELSDDVKPKAYAQYYVDGLFDPVRLPRKVLNDFRARLGEYGYAGQFMQSPIPQKGGMFKPQWFNQRVKAAPYHAVKRVRYWDRACLIRGTSIVTSRGIIEIQDVVVGDLVLTRGTRKQHKVMKPVLWAGKTKEVHEITTVKFANNMVVSGTSDHLVWTENRSWVELGKLVKNDRVISCTEDANFDPDTDSHPWTTVDCSIIRYFDPPLEVYDLEVEDAHEFFANGILVHNSTQGAGCNTVGTLMSYANGNYYVEHVEVGQWEPDERNDRMKAIALRDKGRYSPGQIPTIYVEREGGSSGRDAWKAIARKLAGYSVFEDTVTGAKDTRAEPWAAQCAAGNVFLVDDGTWDIEAWIQEHLLFRPEPGKKLGRMKDRVDSATGAFNRIVGSAPRATSMAIRSPSALPNKAYPRLIPCSRDELKQIQMNERVILIVFNDPGDDTSPEHGFAKLVDSVVLNFADIDPAEHQATWGEEIKPYGKSAEQLLMTMKQGQALWRVVNKKRMEMFQAVVFVDNGDKRALSAAYSVADIWKLGRKKCVWLPNSRDNSVVETNEKAPNPHVYDVIKRSRNMVI